MPSKEKQSKRRSWKQVHWVSFLTFLFVSLLVVTGQLVPPQAGMSQSPASTAGFLPMIIKDQGSRVPIPTPSPTVDVPVSNAFAFIETFDGDPSAPQPWSPLSWDVAIHSRGRENLYSLTPMDAGHGPNCEPPPATHHIKTYEEAVYQCRNHVMTAINDEGYGLIYLTPNRLVDFSNGEAVIRFDMSTLRTSSRDWIDLWITPYGENLQLPLTDWLPDLSGEPRRAVKIEMGVFNGNTIFSADVIRDFVSTRVESDAYLGYEEFLEASATRRDTFELRISNSHLKFGMPDYNYWWVDRDITPLGWTQGVVQLGHHSYNPTKDCSNCGPNTWHWDNVSISRAIPFEIIHADRRFVDAGARSELVFDSPAPQDAYLRFAAIGNLIEVSFDGGVNWQEAQTQAQERYSEGAFWSYWMPIPPGTAEVKFRGVDWWGGGWHVRDVTIWSLEGY